MTNRNQGTTLLAQQMNQIYDKIRLRLSKWEVIRAENMRIQIREILVGIHMLIQEYDDHPWDLPDDRLRDWLLGKDIEEKGQTREESRAARSRGADALYIAENTETDDGGVDRILPF